MKKIINIFGGPGVGKSLNAAGVFYRLKCLGLDVELVPEYAKKLTYEKRTDILSGDQLLIFAKQHRSIEVFSSQADYVVVDSPLLLTQVYFNQKNNKTDLTLLMPLVLDVFNKYPNQNFLLSRNRKYKYQESGRSQTEKEAKGIDDKVADYLLSHSIPCRTLQSSESSVELIVQDILNSVS